MSCSKDKWCVFKEIVVYPEITDIDQKSQAFLDWTEDIRYEENYVILPTGTKIDARIWMSNQLIFNNGSYTKFLLDEYNNRG